MSRIGRPPGPVVKAANTNKKRKGKDTPAPVPTTVTFLEMHAEPLLNVPPPAKQIALTKANNTQYGLSGGIWTDKGAKIFNMTQKVRAGVVWANTFNKFDPTSPFGG